MTSTEMDLSEGVEAEAGAGDSKIMHLVDIWDSSREPFPEWVRDVSRAFFALNMGLESAAKWLDTSPGELAAVLQLATMEDEDLATLGESIPPKTTWFAFAKAGSSGEIQAGLEALEGRESGDSPHDVVTRAMKDVRGPSPEEKVAKLSGEVFFHMSSKAKQYELLWPKAKGFLFDMGKKKSSGGSMTPGQVGYAHDLLVKLVEGGAIKRDSPDDDQEICDMVLDALE